MSEREAMIDEFGELERQVAAFKPVLERHRQLKEQIAGWYEMHRAEDGYVAKGSRYLVQVGPRALKRSIIDMARLFTRLGKGRFLELCSFPLTAVDQHIPEREQDAYVHQERLGPRTVRAVLRSPATAQVSRRRAA